VRAHDATARNEARRQRSGVGKYGDLAHARLTVHKTEANAHPAPTGLSSPAYRDWLDYIVIEDGHAIGRLYEDRNAKAELRWFWSITVYVDPKHGIVTSGRGPTLEEAKAKFLTSWQNATSVSTRQVP
jgi:hypothetical protein